MTPNNPLYQEGWGVCGPMTYFRIVHNSSTFFLFFLFLLFSLYFVLIGDPLAEVYKFAPLGTERPPRIFFPRCLFLAYRTDDLHMNTPHLTGKLQFI